MRVAVKDCRRRDFPREVLDLLGRSKPRNLAEYSFASMKCTITKEPVRIFEMCSRNAFTTRRKPTRQTHVLQLFKGKNWISSHLE